MRLKIYLKRCLPIIIFCQLFAAQYQLVQAQVDNYNELINVLTSDSKKLILEIDIPLFQIEKKSFQTTQFQIINIPGFNQTCEPGKPQLPAKGFLFGIPENANIELEILESNFETSSKNYEIYYTPKLLAEPDLTNDEIDFTNLTTKYESFIDQSVSRSNKFYPAKIAQISEPAFLRDQKIGRLTIHPIQYNPVSGTIRYFRKIKIKLSFSGDNETPNSAFRQSNYYDPYEKILNKSLINYKQSRSWRTQKNTAPQSLFKSSAQTVF